MFVLGRDAGENAVPSVIVAAEHYNMILRIMQAGLPVKLKVQARSRFLDDRNGYNVIADLPGSDPMVKDEVVMIGAHLDSYHSAPGATASSLGGSPSPRYSEPRSEPFRRCSTHGALSVGSSR